MLGMMNASVADSVEFYSASPSTRRAVLENHQQKGESGEQGEGDDQMRVFVEVKDKPQVTYTKDGRKMVDGKLLPAGREQYSQNATTNDPKQMWDRLILSKMAANIHKNSSTQQSLLARCKGGEKECQCHTSRQITTPITIQPTVPIEVSSGNPSVMASLIKPSSLSRANSSPQTNQLNQITNPGV